MLVALMAAVGLYYENQAGESQDNPDAGKGNILVAATAVKIVSEPEPASDIDCESLDLESLDCGENGIESQHTEDMKNSGMDEEIIKPLEH